MKTILLAGAAAILIAGGASAQIQSPSQTGPGGPPMTGMSAQGTGNAADARNTRSMTATAQPRRTQAQRQRAAQPRRASASRAEDQAYMGGGMVMENGRPIDLGTGQPMQMGGRGNMMPDTGVGPGRGHIQDPTGMGTNVMPGGTGSGRGAGGGAGGGGN